MTGFEIVLGVLIALGILAVGIAWVFLSTSDLKPSRHDVRGGGDYAQSGASSSRPHDASSSSGDGGGGGGGR